MAVAGTTRGEATLFVYIMNEDNSVFHKIKWEEKQGNKEQGDSVGFLQTGAVQWNQNGSTGPE